MVGDDDQSIYGWRGAEISNLLDMEKHFPEMKVIKLEQNYRSTNTILGAANAIIKHNVRRRGKKLWSQKGRGREDHAAHALPTTRRRRGASSSRSNTRAWPSAFRGRTRRSSSAPTPSRVRWKRPCARPACATTSSAARASSIGGKSATSWPTSRRCSIPNDDISLLRIANVPARGLSDVTMERLLGASHERKCSVFAVMKNPAVTATFQARTRESIERFVELIERTRGRLQDRKPRPATRTPCKPWPTGSWRRSATSPSCAASEKNPENGREPRPQPQGTDRYAGRRRGRRQPPFDRLETFLEQITLDSEREEEEDEAAGDAVTLITMHSCKGLEFPNVYIVGLEDGLLPHSRSKVEGTLDEERRLFYVAVTRAMQTLTISHCGGRKKYGSLVPCHPSPFLKELPPELVEHARRERRSSP